MHEEHRANPENTRRKTKKKQKRKPIHRLITKRKRANERRERITSCESPSPRPIKKSSTKRSKHPITGTRYSHCKLFFYLGDIYFLVLALGCLLLF